MMRRRLGAMLVLVASACFSDAPPPADEDTTTGGDACAIGSAGCFCTDGNGCDAGLECLLPVGVCVAEGCTPGVGLCECADGSCAEGYKCVQNFCAPEDSATISDTGSGDSTPGDDAVDATDSNGGTGPVTSADSDSITGESGGTSEPTATDPTNDPTTASSSTTSSNPSACAECMHAARAVECSGEWSECTACDNVFECYADLWGYEVCCPAMTAVPSAWHDFAVCVDPICMEQCQSIDCVFHD